MRFVRNKSVQLNASVQYALSQLIMFLLDEEPEFNVTGVGVRSAVRIEQAVRTATGKDFVELEEEDWKRLRNVAEKPKHGYPVYVSKNAAGEVTTGADGKPKKIYFSRKLVALIDAIADAKTKAPNTQDDQPDAAE